MSNVHFVMTIYSHHFCLSRLSPVGRMLAGNFAMRYVQYGLVPSGGTVRRKAIKVYAAANNDRTEYRFHINQLPEFYKLLVQYGYDKPSLYTTVNVPLKETPNVSFTVDEKYIPKDYQVPIIDYVSKTLPKCKLVGLQTGGGKAQKLSELIKIPGGWKKMGDIKVGDIVTAKDGSPTKVTSVHPQGIVPLYKVQFSDGRSTECCGDHLWRVYYINTLQEEQRIVVNTLDMHRLIAVPNFCVYVDLIDPEDCEDVNLPVDPYEYGVFVASDDDVRLAGTNETLSQKYLRIFNNILTRFNIKDKVRYKKTVPEKYLHSSKSQRLSLLQGILDTKGTVNMAYNAGSVSFSSTNYELAKSVQYLARSLGGIAYISKRHSDKKKASRKKTGKVHYSVDINYNKPGELFRSFKKKIKVNSVNQEFSSLKLKVKSVTPSCIEEAQCISIDHPDRLYVTTDFIVTHNTFVALSGIAILQKIPCIIVKPAYIEKWTDDLIKTYNLSLDDIMVVQGSKHLMALLNLVKEGKLEYKAVIVSNKTFQIWLSMYERLKDETLELGYPIHPHEFFGHIGTGVRLIDEVHQDFHFNFKLDLYTNVEHAISLSATLITQDPFLRSMHDLAYPIKDRYVSPPLDKYINSFAVHYRFRKPDKIRTSEYGSKNYSHGAFEKSVIKHTPTLYGYLGLIDYVLSIGYIKAIKRDKKCIIFAYSVDMCTKIVAFLESKYPDHIVNRYVADDPYENLMQSDIVVSTLGSAGTAVDIPNLTNVILTTAIDSIQSNVQSLGRLRKLDNGATDTEFHYFVCGDVPKHLEYHNRKKEMLSQRAKTFIDVYSGYVL